MPWPPSFGAANTPVSSAPRIPPTPCTPNTSSASSAPSIFLRPLTPHRQTMPARKPEDQRAGGSDEAARRRDRDEAGDGAGGGTQHRRLALGHPLDDHPAQHGGGGGDQRVDEREGRGVAGFERRSGVEAEPAHPQERRADHRERQVVRRHRVAAVADPLADHVGADETRDAGVDVHDRAAGEIERALLPQPAALRRFGCECGRILDPVRAGPEPDHVRDRQVGEREPQRPRTAAPPRTSSAPRTRRRSAPR